MDLRQELKALEALETYFILKERPKRINDISLLEKAAVLLDDAKRITGKEYVFKEIQQLSIGSSIELRPKEYQLESTVNWIIGSYDKNIFVQRMKELRGEA